MTPWAPVATGEAAESLIPAGNGRKKDLFPCCRDYGRPRHYQGLSYFFPDTDLIYITKSE